jgi:uncharacterized protein
MPNPFVHIELQTDNPTKAREFYAKVFDWKFEEAPFPGGTYTMIKAGEGPGGGLMQKQNAGAPSAWLSFVQVESVEKSAQKARELGAKILVEPMAIPNMGHYAVIADPSGAAIGLWQSAGR